MHKGIKVLFLTTAIIVATSGFGIAAGGNQAEESSEAPAPGAGADEGRMEKLTGEVVDIDRTGNSLTLRTDQGQEQKLKFDPAVSASLAQIDKGDRVEVSLKDPSTISSINEMGAPPSPGESPSSPGASPDSPSQSPPSPGAPDMGTTQ
jgi:hypothetical protein